MVITNGFTFIAFLIFVAGGLLALEKYTKSKLFYWVPVLVWVYVLNMLFCTMGLYDSDGCRAAYSALKNNLLYGMIFVMLLRCDFRKLVKLGGRMAAIFLGGSFTLAIGFILGFPLFKGILGGGEKTWAAVAALYASWVGGSPNMAAMQDALPVDSGAFGCALALDTVCYSFWIALLLLGVRYAGKWNAVVQADTSKLDAVAEAANAEVVEKKEIPVVADWVFLIGLSLVVSVISQWVGGMLGNVMSAIHLDVINSGICTTLFVTFLGLGCAMTPLGKLPAVNELNGIYLYAVISLLASTSSITDLLAAPMWVIYGLFVLVIHAVTMFLLSKLFHWDLCMVSTASLANIGGTASAPLIASAYNPSFASIGILMGVMGSSIGNILGLGMGAILSMLV